MEKISTALSAKINLIVILAVVWAVIQLMILLLFKSMHILPGTIVFLIVLAATLKSFTGNVKMNDCHVLLNYFSKKRRVVFEGLYWKLPWEEVEFIVNLEATIHTKVRGTFPTTDGSMEIEAAIMSKPDSGIGESETERSRKMINYVRYTEDAIKNMQTTTTEKTIREKVKDKKCSDVKSFTQEQLLKKGDFDEVAKELSIVVIECPINDVDYNEEVQRARNAASKATAITEMVKTLINAGYEDKEARILAPLLDKDISLSKIVHDNNYNVGGEFNINGLSFPPELVKALVAILKKHGGK
jgi:hypothetical protein